MREGAIVGTLLTILLWTSQLISRQEADIFQHPDLDLEYIAEFEQKWVGKICDTLALAQSQLHLTDHWTPTKNQVHDQALMEFFFSQGYTPRELAQLNCCRMFLQVNMLSEIYNAKGERVMEECLNNSQ